MDRSPDPAFPYHGKSALFAQIIALPAIGGRAILLFVYEALRFRVTTDICRLWPPGPERDWRLALLDATIERAIDHATGKERPSRVAWSSIAACPIGLLVLAEALTYFISTLDDDSSI